MSKKIKWVRFLRDMREANEQRVYFTAAEMQRHLKTVDYRYFIGTEGDVQGPYIVELNGDQDLWRTIDLTNEILNGRVS